jgi:DNA-binding beta-propeller fold protein YncE
MSSQRYIPRHSKRVVKTHSGHRSPFGGRIGWAVFLLGLLILTLGTVLEATGRIDLLGGQGAPLAAGGLEVGAASPATTHTIGAPPATRHRVKIITHPAGARVRIQSENGLSRIDRTPFAAKVPEGEVTLILTHKGYNRLTEQVVVSRNRRIELWLDPKGLLHHKLGTFRTGAAPKQVAFSPDGEEIWVTLLGGDGVQVFDTETRRLLDNIDLGDYGAVEIIFSRDGSKVYASQMETASVFVIDAETRKVRRQLLTHSAWSKVMALSPNGKRLYVANWTGNNVTELSLSTGKVRRQIPTVATPRGLHVTRHGKRLFVAGFEGGEVQRINLVSGDSRILLRTGGAMRHLVSDPSRGLLYADDMATDEVYVIDLATERVRKLADTDHTPNTMDLGPDGRVLYVSNRGANHPVSYYLPGPEWGSVLAIDTSSGAILDAIVGGNQTTGLDVSSDGLMLAFSDFLDNRVTLFAIPSYEALEAGDGGRAVAHLEELQKAS